MEIFTTGAYLSPVQQADGRWRWGVFGFELDSFIGDDMTSAKILESAETLEELEASVFIEDDK